MKALTRLLCLQALVISVALQAEDASPYPVASFGIEQAVINPAYPAWSPRMSYNHDSDITRFRGRYIAAWNANPENPEEGRPGQLNYLSVSDDFQHWSQPVPIFTSQGGAVLPVDSTGSELQWQPNFINDRNETLFCAWCVSGRNAGAYISRSTDGLHWENTRITEPLPDSYDRSAAPGAFPFPSNHGLLTRAGVMLFPICLVPSAVAKGQSLQVAALISQDGGSTWHWGNFTPVMLMKPFLKPGRVNTGKKQEMRLWEPHFYEHPDGKIGLLVRVNNTAPEDGLTSDQMILKADSSDGGRTFSPLRTADIQTISSRHMSFSMTRSPGDLLLAANDWLTGFSPYPRDRHFLSLYLSPVCDPDLLIPGPVIQKPGAIGHYPNGEINDGELILSYSYGMKPRDLLACRIKGLPEFKTPFFLQRESRPQVEIDPATHTAHFPETYSSLGLVLTPALSTAAQLTLAFTARLLTMPNYYPGLSPDEAVNSLTLLTIGAVDHHHTRLRVSGPTPPYDLQLLKNNRWVKIAEVGLRQPIRIHLTLTDKTYSVQVGDSQPISVPGRLNRKINFGGFYTPPIAYPTTGTFDLDLKSVRVR